MPDNESKPKFKFRNPTEKELKEMYPDDMAREAVKDAMDKRAEKENKKTIKKKAGGALKPPANPGLKKLPTKVRNKMGYMKAGGTVKKCKRDGIAIRGRTKGRMVQNE